MKLFIYFILLISLNSCFCTYEVVINKNGSAHIEIYDWDEYEGEKIEESLGGEEFYSGYNSFKKSPIISNFKSDITNGLYKIVFDIENVDSLQYYLFPPEIGSDYKQTTFKYSNETFLITHTFEENGPSEVTMYGDLNPVKIIFRFKKKIKNFNSELDFVKQIDKKTIEINATLNEISYGKGTHKVVVLF